MQAWFEGERTFLRRAGCPIGCLNELQRLEMRMRSHLEHEGKRARVSLRRKVLQKHSGSLIWGRGGGAISVGEGAAHIRSGLASRAQLTFHIFHVEAIRRSTPIELAPPGTLHTAPRSDK